MKASDRTVFIVASVLAAGMFAAQWFGDSTPTTTAPSTPTPAPMPYEVTAPALYAAYQRNEVAEQMRIGKRPVLIAGVVDSIGLDMLGAPVLQFDEGDGFSTAGMSLLKVEKPAAARLHKGDVVTVLCKHMQFVLGDAEGGTCAIMAVRP